MSDENETNGINLSLNGKNKHYKDKNKLKDFITTEIAYWRWLSEITILRHAAAELRGKVYNKLETSAQRLDSGSLADISIGGDGIHYVTADSVEGKLTGRVREAYGDVVAFFVLYFLLEEARGLAAPNTHLGNAMVNASFTRDINLAASIVFSRKEKNRLYFEAHGDTVDKLTDNFSSLVESAIEKVQTQEEKVRMRIEQSDRDRELSYRRNSQRFSRRYKAYRSLAIQVKDAAKDSLNKAGADLASAKDAYHDQVDLDASVQYWKTRGAEHFRGKYLWLAAVVVFMALTFCTLVGYYSAGGATGIAQWLNSSPTSVQPTSKEVNKDNETATMATIKDAATSEVKTTPNISSAMQIPSTEISMAIADLTGAALLVTLLAVMIRIGLRQFNTHSHFVLDAAERVTLTKTYLALLNEGKLKSEEDRRLVLESLFRSSQPGAISDTHFSSPVELIIKSFTGVKPTT